MEPIKQTLQPFCCETKGLSNEQVQKVLDLAIKCGANEYESTSCRSSDRSVSVRVRDYPYFGVDVDLDTYLHAMTDSYNDNLLTYLDVIAYLRTVLNTQQKEVIEESQITLEHPQIVSETPKLVELLATGYDCSTKDKTRSQGFSENGTHSAQDMLPENIREALEEYHLTFQADYINEYMCYFFHRWRWEYLFSGWYGTSWGFV